MCLNVFFTMIGMEFQAERKMLFQFVLFLLELHIDFE